MAIYQNYGSSFSQRNDMCIIYNMQLDSFSHVSAFRKRGNFPGFLEYTHVKTALKESVGAINYTIDIVYAQSISEAILDERAILTI